MFAEGESFLDAKGFSDIFRVNSEMFFMTK